ncbi:uncharacterized protein LOC106003500 [Mustela putorius furo]|uniref:Uncharacterized protein LOC106003500 n=1 Tax=Mustela putorius furo TaxID=9669 RepID=A0A8U0S7X5_MUSPF|nr:uncharacterized protein LOC106003500 [Mustela putorius furo]
MVCVCVRKCIPGPLPGPFLLRKGISSSIVIALSCALELPAQLVREEQGTDRESLEFRGFLRAESPVVRAGEEENAFWEEGVQPKTEQEKVRSKAQQRWTPTPPHQVALGRTVATEWCLSSSEGAWPGTQSVCRLPGRLASVVTTLETRGHGKDLANICPEGASHLPGDGAARRSGEMLILASQCLPTGDGHTRMPPCSQCPGGPVAEEESDSSSSCWNSPLNGGDMPALDPGSELDIRTPADTVGH